jgi:hypothetical protein
MKAKKKVPTQQAPKRQPTHNVFVVTDDNWEIVGVAWEHQDGQGLSIKIAGVGSYALRKR